LGGLLTAAFVFIAGINYIFGFREDTRVTASQLSRDKEFQNKANLPIEFQFIGQGRITGGSDDKWLIGNVAIQVDEHSQINTDLHPGDFVSLSGRILHNGEWLADQIGLTQEGESFFTFNGPLEWVQGADWRIGGHTLLTDAQTKIGSNLIVNDLLLATFTVLDTGGWMALEIKAFERFPLEPTPIAPATPTQSPTQIPEPTKAPIKTEVSSPKPASVSKPSKDDRGKKTEPSKPKNNPHSKGKGHKLKDK
jgi:hypothetical protein